MTSCTINTILRMQMKSVSQNIISHMDSKEYLRGTAGSGKSGLFGEFPGMESFTMEERAWVLSMTGRLLDTVPEDTHFPIFRGIAGSGGTAVYDDEPLDNDLASFEENMPPLMDDIPDDIDVLPDLVCGDCQCIVINDNCPCRGG